MADIYDWPAELVPQENEFYLAAVTKQFESPFTGATQTLEYPGAKWQISLKFKNLTREQMRRLEVTVLQLRGTANRIRIPDHAIKRLGAGGAAVVDGAGQAGRVLMIKNAPADVDYLLTGDYFEIGGELKRMIGDARTDSTGKTVLRFEPALRKSPANNAAINADTPCATVRQEKDDGSKVKRVVQFGSVSLSFVEDILR